MLRYLAAALLSFAGSAALAEEVTTYTLDNGMEVVVIEDHRAPVVVHMVWYRVGSADEPEGVSGIAHFLEHLMFKQTETTEAGEFGEVIAANGGTGNAFTSYDFTGYFQRVAADRLELMMEYEADRMENLVLLPEDVETERLVILEERNQRTENSPGALAQEQIRAAQYQNHRYGVPIIGWMHEMEELSLEDAQAFYDLYYSPNNAILVVAGDVEPEEVLALAEEHYGVIPEEPDLPERTRPEEPPQLAERRLVFEDQRVSQPYLSRTYLAPERDSGAQEEAAALVYLAELLGGSPFTSELGVALQFDTQTAVYTNAFYSGGSLDDTTFGLIVVPTEEVTLAEAEEAMDRVIADFMAAEIDTEALERIRTQLRASEVYAKDDVQGLARRYGAGLTQGLTVEDIQAWPNILQEVTAEEIKAAAEALFDRDRSVTAYVVPTREALTH